MQHGKALIAHVARFPALGFQVRWHQPPAQEKMMLCDRGREKQRTRMLARAPSLEHGVFTVRPEALVGIAKLDCDTDVDVSTEVAVGTWVGCDSVDQALTSHSTAASLGACGEQDCPQYRGRPSRDKRHSDGLCLYTRDESYNAFLFRPSDRHLQVSSSLVGAALLQNLTRLTGALSAKGPRGS